MRTVVFWVVLVVGLFCLVLPLLFSYLGGFDQLD
jgi:hypothetical protein